MSYNGILLYAGQEIELLNLKICTMAAELKSKEKTAEQVKQNIEELKEAAKPLMVYLAEKFHPHHTCIVTSTTCEISEGVMSIGQTLEYVPD